MGFCGLVRHAHTTGALCPALMGRARSRRPGSCYEPACLYLQTKCLLRREVTQTILYFPGKDKKQEENKAQGTFHP